MIEQETEIFKPHWVWGTLPLLMVPGVLVMLFVLGKRILVQARYDELILLVPIIVLSLLVWATMQLRLEVQAEFVVLFTGNIRLLTLGRVRVSSIVVFYPFVIITIDDWGQEKAYFIPYLENTKRLIGMFPSSGQ
jgi:membrane-associated HD superfamily phosphohydrolase